MNIISMIRGDTTPLMFQRKDSNGDVIKIRADRIYFTVKESDLPDGTFSGCQSLSYIKIPSEVTSIGQNCFYNCYSVKYYDFREHTSVPTLGTNAFYGISSYNQIVVPDDLYDTWIAATNWSTYASYIVKASEVSI